MPIFKVANEIQVTGAGEKMKDFICSGLTISNPKYQKLFQMARCYGRGAPNEYMTKNTPQYLYFYESKQSCLLVPRGFLPDLIKYCEDNDSPFRLLLQYHSQAHYLPTFNFKGKLKPFQKDAVDIILSQDQGTLCAPTGAGKTVMALYMISQRSQRTLIIVHTKELVNQWIDRINTFLGIPKEDIGRIGEGKLKEGEEITVGLIQTLRNHSEVVNNYNYLVVDECHKAPARTFTDVVKEYSGRYLNGLSATPFRADGLSKVIGWYVGKVLVKISPKQLIKDGHIVGVKPIIRYTFYKSGLPDPAQEYSVLLQDMSLDRGRNEMIVKDIIAAVDMGEVCLVLTDRKGHCRILKDMILEQRKIMLAILTGEVGKKDRESIVKQVNAGKIKILIATGQLIGEGFDCNNLSSLFLTLPVKFAGRIIQYVGRVLRPKQGKTEAKIYDYFDPSVVCLYSGLKSRESQYKKLMAIEEEEK